MDNALVHVSDDQLNEFIRWVDRAIDDLGVDPGPGTETSEPGYIRSYFQERQRNLSAELRRRQELQVRRIISDIRLTAYLEYDNQLDLNKLSEEVKVNPNPTLQDQADKVKQRGQEITEKIELLTTELLTLISRIAGEI